MPLPVSSTKTCSASSVLSTRTVTVPSAGVNLIALPIEIGDDLHDARAVGRHRSTRLRPNQPQRHAVCLGKRPKLLDRVLEQGTHIQLFALELERGSFQARQVEKSLIKLTRERTLRSILCKSARASTGRRPRFPDCKTFVRSSKLVSGDLRSCATIE